jgi:hypothetical protein
MVVMICDYSPLKKFRRLPAWGGHAGKSGGDTKIPVKGRAGVVTDNIHPIYPDYIKKD